ASLNDPRPAATRAHIALEGGKNHKAAIEGHVDGCDGFNTGQVARQIEHRPDRRSHWPAVQLGDVALVEPGVAHVLPGPRPRRTLARDGDLDDGRLANVQAVKPGSRSVREHTTRWQGRVAGHYRGA